jgi:hypothetical protein
MDGKPDAGLDADSLIQIEMLEALSLGSHRQNGHIGMVAQPHLGLAHLHGTLAPDKLQDLTVLGLLGHITPTGTLRLDDAVGLKGKLVQIADHNVRLQSLRRRRREEIRYSVAIITNVVEICKGYFTFFTNSVLQRATVFAYLI